MKESDIEKIKETEFAEKVDEIYFNLFIALKDIEVVVESVEEFQGIKKHIWGNAGIKKVIRGIEGERKESLARTYEELSERLSEVVKLLVN
jgi:hypothetical protein